MPSRRRLSIIATMARALAILVALLMLLPSAAAGVQGVGSAGVAGLAAGGQHTCAITDDRRGSVICWGRLPAGPGAPARLALLPELQPWVEGATLLAAGTDHDCALLGYEGPLLCWGDNAFGQLGDGLAGDDALEPLSRVELDGEVLDLVAGDAHTCLLMGEGEVLCWGRGDGGQLGDGARRDRGAPEEVTRRSGRALRGAVSVAAGSDHTCAALRDGRVLCWGGGSDGAAHPRRVPEAPALDMLAAGSGWTCGALFPGEPWCWDTAGGPPSEVDGAPALIALAGSAGQACGIDEAFDVWCWEPLTGVAAPVPASDAAGFVAVGAGHACLARADDGTARCWGDGEAGQIGDGSLRDSPVPVDVTLGATPVPAASPSPAPSPSPAASPSPAPSPSPATTPRRP
jgi:hypothetical protein